MGWRNWFGLAERGPILGSGVQVIGAECSLRVGGWCRQFKCSGSSRMATSASSSGIRSRRLSVGSGGGGRDRRFRKHGMGSDCWQWRSVGETVTENFAKQNWSGFDDGWIFIMTKLDPLRVCSNIQCLRLILVFFFLAVSASVGTRQHNFRNFYVYFAFSPKTLRQSQFGANRNKFSGYNKLEWWQCFFPGANKIKGNNSRDYFPFAIIWLVFWWRHFLVFQTFLKLLWVFLFSKIRERPTRHEVSTRRKNYVV